MPFNFKDMKNNYYLPGLNANEQIQESLEYCIDQDKMPEVYLFYHNTNAFYRKYFNELDEVKLREKRFLDFETPNRSLITHEYDIQIDDNFDYDKYYYLFNPITRLSWLKISLDNKRLSVANSDLIKEKIRVIIEPELKKYFPTSYQEKFDELWSKKKGLPCFIKLENIGHKGCLLTASYYDSIKKESRRKTKLELMHPLLERRIKYEYYPLKNKSSWLYIKAPDGFNVKYNIKEDNSNNLIDYANSYNQEADPEKISLTIINKKNPVVNTIDDTVIINIDIIVPESLKIWFLTIYYLTLATFFFIIGYIINHAYISLFTPIFNTNILSKIVNSSNFGGLILAIVGAIIATRGWLIKEETIFKQYSKHLTIMMILVILFYIVILIISP